MIVVIATGTMTAIDVIVTVIEAVARIIGMCSILHLELCA